MKSNKLKVIIILLAAIVVSIFNIIQEYSLKQFSYTLLIVVVIFYFVGGMVQKIVNDIIKKEISPELELPSQTIGKGKNIQSDGVIQSKPEEKNQLSGDE